MNQIEMSISYAKATLEIEGRTLTPEAEELIRRRLRGEIMQDEFLRLAKQLAESRADRDEVMPGLSKKKLFQICESATRAARERAFATGGYVSYCMDGQLGREYPNGEIVRVP